MLAHVLSSTLRGIEALAVRVEASIGTGLPALLTVGLPGAAVQESRERVRAALQNSGLPFPLRRVVVNLAPADVRKEGPAFDLPIALALLLAQGALPPECLRRMLVLGELALDGELRPVRGSASVALLAARLGLRRLIVPPGNAAEAAAVSGVDVIAPDTLAHAVDYLRGRTRIAVRAPPPTPTSPPPPELADVRGQSAAKRALEICAAGAHNLLMTGPPGSGKTMLAERLVGLLPHLTGEEAVEATRIHSAAGIPTGGLLTRPPSRQPHHSLSYAALIGGGSTPRPGEVSLAHCGVLLLDELPEFSRPALEALRGPLEDGVVTVSRLGGRVTFPARFLLVGTRNPCRCGYAGDPVRTCVCTPTLVHRYRERLSGPLLDRLDVHITVPRAPPEDLLRHRSAESSSQVKERVERARRLALDRQGGANAQLSGESLRRHARLDAAGENFTRQAARRLALSGRGLDRLLRVARTIADLAGSVRICEEHLAEAVAYRGEG